MSELRMMRLHRQSPASGLLGDDSSIASRWKHLFMIRDEWDLDQQEPFDEIVEWCRDRYGPQAPFVNDPRPERWTTDELLLIFFNDDALAFEFQTRWC